MTILSAENKQDAVLTQDTKDTTASQEQISLNVAQNAPESTTEEPKEDVNWRAFREARKKDRAEREAAEKRAQEKEAEAAALRAAMEAAFSNRSAVSPSAYQQYYGLQPEHEQATQDQNYDAVLEKKVEALLFAKEEKLRQDRAEQERRDLPNRLNRELPGFHEICSQENIDYLDYHFPEIARPLGRLPDDFNKYADIYNAVKKFVPNHTDAKKDSIRADMNLLKPKAMNTVGRTPAGQAGPESWKDVEQRRQANYERMQRLIKGGS